MFGRSNEAQNPEVIPPKTAPSLGTGPAMLMRALGVDPQELMNKAGEFEVFAKAAITELIERMKAIDTKLAELKAAGVVQGSEERLKFLEDRLVSFEERTTENLLRMTEGFAELANTIKTIVAVLGNPVLDDALVPKRKPPSRTVVNGLLKEGEKHGR